MLLCSHLTQQSEIHDGCHQVRRNENKISQIFCTDMQGIVLGVAAGLRSNKFRLCPDNCIQTFAKESNDRSKNNLIFIFDRLIRT